MFLKRSGKFARFLFREKFLWVAFASLTLVMWGAAIYGGMFLGRALVALNSPDTPYIAIDPEADRNLDIAPASGADD